MTSHEPTQKGIPRYIITEPQLAAIEMVLKESGINIKRNRLLSEIRANTYPPGEAVYCDLIRDTELCPEGFR